MLTEGPTLIDALQSLYPSRQWTVHGNSYEGVLWDDDLSRPTKEEVEAKLQELIDAQPLKELRRERNRRLAEVDWVFSTDYQMEDEERSVWVAYRQALRDLPSTTEDPTNPVWPTKPSTPKGTTLDVNLKNIKDRELSEKSQITLLQNVVYSLTKRIEALENA
jgi:hypothetical protein